MEKEKKSLLYAIVKKQRKFLEEIFICCKYHYGIFQRQRTGDNDMEEL